MARLSWGAALLLLSGCGDDVAESRPIPTPPPPEGCVPGELTLDDGSCQPAGVPPGECASGFVAEAGGCTAILPRGSCGDGTMAVPGDTACRPVAVCGAGKWGDIVIEPGAVYVDAAYTGGGDDGSSAKPFASLAVALASAPDGAQVVMAAGSYNEAIPALTRAVKIWGTCPSEVTIVGSAPLELRADASEVHGVAFEGGGLLLVGALDAVVERVWIHDTVDRGLEVSELGGPSSVTLRDSLIEGATGLGVFLYGSELVIERSDVRETVDYPAAYASMGVGAFDSSASDMRSTLVIRGSVVQDNPACGVFAYGADATIEGSVVRRTRVDLAGRMGMGMFPERDPDTGAAAKGTVVGSVFEANHTSGIYLLGAELDMRATTVRDTLFDEADPSGGSGLYATGDGVARASVQASASLLERNLWIGSYLSDGDAKLAGILVRDTKAAADGHLGVGVGVDVAEGGGRGALELTGSLVEHNENGGLYILGADATIEGTLVRDSLPEPISQQFGRGIQIQNTSMGDRANVVVRDSLVERSMDVGVFAAGADLILERTVIRDTAPRAVDGKIGDGLALFGGFSPTQATVEEVTIANSARAGILNYSGVVTIGASVLECNVIHLNGETASTPYEFVVTSPSVCGCKGATEDCKVLSSMLEPPTAPSE